MNKSIFILIGVILLTFGVYAENVNVVLTYIDGERLVIPLEEEPVMTIEEENLFISTETSSYLCPLSEISDYVFSDIVNGIGEVRGDFTLNRMGNMISVSSVSAPLHVSLVSLQGLLLRNERRNAGEEIELDITDVEPGFYLLSINGKTIKIVR